MGIYDMFPTDIIHTFYSGLHAFVFETVLENFVHSDLKSELDRRFVNISKFYGNKYALRVFKCVSSMKVPKSRDYSILIRHLPLVIGYGENSLIGEEETRSKVHLVLKNLIHLEEFVLMGNWDLDTMREYEAAVDDFYSSVMFLTVFSKSKLLTPKVHMLVHYPLFVSLYGVPLNFDTGHFEMFHKTCAKLPFKFDNHHEGASERMLQSVIQKGVLLEVGEYLKTETQNHHKTEIYPDGFFLSGPYIDNASFLNVLPKDVLTIFKELMRKHLKMNSKKHFSLSSISRFCFFTTLTSNKTGAKFMGDFNYQSSKLCRFDDVMVRVEKGQSDCPARMYAVIRDIESDDVYVLIRWFKAVRKPTDFKSCFYETYKIEPLLFTSSWGLIHPGCIQDHVHMVDSEFHLNSYFNDAAIHHSLFFYNNHVLRNSDILSKVVKTDLFVDEA